MAQHSEAATLTGVLFSMFQNSFLSLTDWRVCFLFLSCFHFICVFVHFQIQSVAAQKAINNYRYGWETHLFKIWEYVYSVIPSTTSATTIHSPRAQKDGLRLHIPVHTEWENYFATENFLSPSKSIHNLLSDSLGNRHTKETHHLHSHLCTPHRARWHKQRRKKTFMKSVTSSFLLRLFLTLSRSVWETYSELSHWYCVL